MKADALTNKPTYDLLKQSDIVDFYHLQLPRWLMEDRRYMHMTLEAKFTYMLLFNRFQLSKRNGWMNEDGEVFVVYTRGELAGKLNIGEKRVTAAMNELRDFGLIWERRCGRGFANQIYLARVRISEQDAAESTGGPMDALPEEHAESRTAEMTDLDSAEPLEPLIEPLQNSQTGVSRTVETAGQEPPNPPPSKEIYKQFDLSGKESQVSQGQYDTTNVDVDADIADILSNIYLGYFNDEDAAVVRDTVERLFFSDSIRVGQAVYPRDRIRFHLQRLDYEITQDALHRLHKNRDKIRNSSAYTTTVLFNTIMESGSDLLLDPYLNHLRAQPAPLGAAGGGAP